MLYPPDEIPLRTRLLQLPVRLFRLIGAAAAILIWPVEFCIGFLANKAFAASEGLEGFEYAVARLV
jgi:hypothetical protein